MIGQRISMLRKSRGMTQRQLAKAMKVSTSAIGMYEQGRREPSAELIVKLCDYFSVSTQYLLTGTPYSPRSFESDLRALLSQPPGSGEISAPAREIVEQLLRELPRQMA